MKTALIGFTGFVGSNLCKQTSFDDYYNSKNIEGIRGKKYKLIISTGVRGERWKANLNPLEDWTAIKDLMDNLKFVKADHFILISTIDVYPKTVNIDEDYPVRLSQLTQPYGRHRLRLEKFAKKHFPKTTFIRLPQIFGSNIKKNFVYDLIFDNALDFTHKNTFHQWYNLKNLSRDMKTAIEHSIPIVNFAVEPIAAWELAKYTRNMEFKTITKNPPLEFDFHTKYAKLFGSKDRYIYHKEQLLKELKAFISTARKTAAIDKQIKSP